MKRWLLAAAVACLFSSLFLCFTQEQSRGPDGATGHHVSGVEVLAIPGKPFSAKDSIDWTRTQQDGSAVTLHLDAFLARDGQGRVYRERHHFVPANSTDRAPLYEIHMYDPVSRTQLLCDGRKYRCALYDYKPQTSFEPTPEGTYQQETRALSRQDLGQDLMEGVSVKGTRETWTINSGAAGNERPLVRTREFWYSDELKTNLAVTRIDPLDGKQVIRLSQISRGEPNPHLWDVPVGFTVRDLRASAGRRK